MESTEQTRLKLVAQLDRLVGRVGRIEGDLRKPRDPDWPEAAVEAENDDVLERLDAATRLEVAAIRAAIQRLDAGTYTVCAKCGRRIDERRLRAMPTTTTCLTCAL
jgi:RNA polymerase-binding transcription factor DksA